MKSLGWLGILRLGLVQMALGSIVVLATATLNRVMVVELALPAVLPGFLVALYQGSQITRPKFGHAADRHAKRTPWILGGLAVLVAGGIAAALSVVWMETNLLMGIVSAILAFIAIGAGIGAAGTNLLALLAARVDDNRKAAAGSAVWIMMIFGLAVTGITAGANLDPYSHTRLIAVTCAVGGIAMLLGLIGTWGIERGGHAPQTTQAKTDFRVAMREVWEDRTARAFAIFVFTAMLAYNTQDLILEPYAGHVFGMTPGESTQLGGMHHAGALVGMILVLVAGTALKRWFTIPIHLWVVGGCAASGIALIALGLGGQSSSNWPIAPNVFALGFSNGVFAVAAIGAMMMLATGGTQAREGTRMGIFGAAQAIAFGAGSFLGTVFVDVMRLLTPDLAVAYGTVFMGEGIVFLLSALLAARITFARGTSMPSSLAVPGE
jgi:BCD family chlorophyll transporter-like MFS transporter